MGKSTKYHKASLKKPSKAKKNSSSSSTSYIALNVNESSDESDGYQLDELGLVEQYSPVNCEDEEEENETLDDDEEEDTNDRVAWGNKLKNYYEGDDDVSDVDISDADEELTNDRIAEAKQIAKELYENVKEEDAELDEFTDQPEVSQETNLNDLLLTLTSKFKHSDTQELPPNFFKLNDDDKTKLLDKEHPEFLSLALEFLDTLKTSKEQISTLLQPNTYKLCNKEGMEYLDIRNELLLYYLLYLTYYMMLKCNGQSIKDHPVVKRLIEIRLILDKTRSIEENLQYEINTILQNIPDNQLKPRPDMLVTEPRITSKIKQKRIDHDEREESRINADESVSHRKGGRKQEPETFYNEVIDNNMDAKQKRLLKRIAEHEEYEMENMKRVQLDKAQRKELMNAKRDQKYTNSGYKLGDLGDLADNIVNKKRLGNINTGLNQLAQKIKQDIITSRGHQFKENRPKKTGSTTVMQNKIIDTNIENDRIISKMKEGYYEKKAAIKKQKQTKHTPKFTEDVVDGKRIVTKEILKNKGLTRMRKKTEGNARVQNRKKYEKKRKVHEALHRTKGTEPVNYQGEETGINVMKKKSFKI